MMDNKILHDTNNQQAAYKPTTAYVGASWGVMIIGMLAYLFGLWNNAAMQLNEKGYYLAVLALGLYAAVSLQKTLRDKAEGIPTTAIYYSISWAALALAVLLIMIGLYNADGLNISEKGFYMMAFTMSLFAAVTIQKNIRDDAQAKNIDKEEFGLADNNIDPIQENRLFK